MRKKKLSVIFLTKIYQNFKVRLYFPTYTSIFSNSHSLRFVRCSRSSPHILNACCTVYGHMYCTLKGSFTSWHTTQFCMLSGAKITAKRHRNTVSVVVIIVVVPIESEQNAKRTVIVALYFSIEWGAYTLTFGTTWKLILLHNRIQVTINEIMNK